MKSLLFLPKWQKVLLYIYVNKGCNTIRVSKKLNITYTHVLNIIKELQKNNIIFRDKQGREVLLSVTKIGEYMGSSIATLGIGLK